MNIFLLSLSAAITIRELPTIAFNIIRLVDEDEIELLRKLGLLLNLLQSLFQLVLIFLFGYQIMWVFKNQETYNTLYRETSSSTVNKSNYMITDFTRESTSINHSKYLKKLSTSSINRNTSMMNKNTTQFSYEENYEE